MPPEDQVRTWLLVYYTLDQPQSPDKYWPKFGREQYDTYKAKLKVNDDVKKAADDGADGKGVNAEQQRHWRRL